MNELTAIIGPLATLSPDFESFEEAVFRAVCEAGRREAALALVRLDDILAADAPPGLMIKDRRTRCVLTRFGPVEVARRRYIGAGGRCRYLLDERLGLASGARVSPSLERLIVTLGSEVSFRHATAVVSAVCGCDVSHATAHAALGRAGERLGVEGALAAANLHDEGIAPPGERQAPRLHCEADGTVIALQGTKTRRGEVRLAVFYTDKRAGVPVVHLGFQKTREFWREASAAAGGCFDISTIKEVVLAGDGAGWVRKGADVLPHARYQLDPFHIHQALLRSTGSHPVSAAVFAAIYESGPGAADALLERFGRENPARLSEVLKVRGYLASNADGLWRSDPSCGTIEGHIDKIAAARFKKRGRRWSPHGADRMAHVIAAKRSGRPLPVGIWEPRPAASAPRPLTAAEAVRTSRKDRVPHQAGIVSHDTGAGFTRKLRDIAGTRRSDW